MKKIRISKDYFLEYPEAILQIDYAMARFIKSEIGFKIKQRDPKVFFSAKKIPKKSQVVLHLRMPVKDEWNDINEFLDIDIYFQQSELEKIVELA